MAAGAGMFSVKTWPGASPPRPEGEPFNLEKFMLAQNFHRLPIRPIFADTDAMNIVYYANYLRFFEHGRTELMRAAGLPYSQIEASGLHFPVSEVGVTYRHSAHYDELLYLDTWLAWIKRASLRFEYCLRRAEDGRELTTGFSVHGCVSRQGKISALPAQVKATLTPFVGGARIEQTPGLAPACPQAVFSGEK
jgi:acyl-CoA thioester hydrolase